MPTDKPIHVVGFNYKKESGSIRGIQVILSNGVISPLFECDSKAKLETIAINSEVKKIRGSEIGTPIGRIHFLNKNGIEIGKIIQWVD